MNIKYFDNAATTRIKEEVLKEMIPYFYDFYGNPSSLYSIGRNAKKSIEEARQKVANLIGANANEIYFTAGGTESDNTALKGIAFANKDKGNHIVTSRIEHPAILNSCKFLEKQGFDITYINVDKEGKVKLEELEDVITDKTILISIMYANNEIGTIQPISQIAEIANKKNIIFHTDAVQAVGNIPINVKQSGIDMLSLSGHKIYGPKGIGALYVKKGINFDRYLDGGHQERDKRSGTENVPGIVGLGKACELAKSNLVYHQKYLKSLRDYYNTKIVECIPNTKLNGASEDRLPGNSNISFKNMDANALIFKLDQKGICVSSGSACSSKDSKPSHVLVAIGLSKEMLQGALRVTFGEDNTKEDVDYLISAIKEALR